MLSPPGRAIQPFITPFPAGMTGTMTEMIHFIDCYASSFEASVVKVEGSAVELDRTAFYPEGGGQPCDRGMLAWSEGEVPVSKVRKDGGRVLHTVVGSPPSPGDLIRGEIDWDRRYSHMRYHTAQHLLSAHFLERHGAQTTGNQIWPDRARIDFDLPDLTQDMVDSAQGMVNGWIDRNLPVRISMVPRNEAISRLDPRRTRIDRLPRSVKVLRVVEVPGIDTVACAGTHVRETGELGVLRVTRTSSKGRGRKRVEFILGTQ